MKSSSLLCTAFAALLIASPGVALAQAGGNGQRTNGENGAVQKAQNATGGVAYSHIGQGGYTGEALPISGNNGNGNNGNGNGNGSGSSAPTRPSQRNPLLADNGDVEISQMVGTAVFNERDQNLGTVNGVLVGRNGVWAVVATNNKKVAVPFGHFVFGNAKVNGDDKLVLPHYTEARLNTLPTYHYKATNYPANNG